MEKIDLNFEKSCNQQITQLRVQAEDIVTLFPHKDCQITVEFTTKINENGKEC